MKISSTFKGIIVLCAVVLSFYFVWNLNFVEDFVGRFMASDPKRSDQLYERFKDEDDATLLRLMHHGDFNKAGVATQILAERGNPDLYEKVFSKLKDRSKDVRIFSRSLIVSLNQEKAVAYFLNELSKSNLPKDARRQMIGILVTKKIPEAYPILVKEASQSDAWKQGVVWYLGEYGDPRVLPILQEIKKTIPKDNQDINARLVTKDVDRAIKKLEEIQLSNESNSGDT